jgi:cytoskeletal protein CcmA (bactofilin family)
LKIKVISISLLLAVLTFTARAVDFIQQEQFVSGSTETLQEETWISAQSVTMDGTMLNDLFAVGGTLNLRGAFQGDVWGAGDQVTLSGIFNDNVRTAARMVQVSGTLNGSLTAAGNTVKVDPSAIIKQDAFCLGKNVISEGTVAGNVQVVAQKATLGGKVNGNVSVAAQDIVILPGTEINGNLSYTAPSELVPGPSVILKGKLTRLFRTPPPRQTVKSNLIGHFTFAVAALFTGLVFSLIFPRYIGNTVYLLNTSRKACLLVGFAALFLIPFAAFLLFFTLIGLPLSILLLVAYLMLLYLSKIIVGLWLGAFIARRKQLSKRCLFSTLAIGLIIIYALTAFTAINLIVNILIVMFGLGAMLLSLFRKPVLVIQTPNTVKQTTED